MKNKSPSVVQWTAPIMFVGNFMFSLQEGIDTSGALDRRMMLFEFKNIVSNRDNNMKTDIYKYELGAVLFKILRCYLMNLCLFPSLDWQHEVDVGGVKVPIIGKQMADWQYNGRCERDPLLKFLRDECEIVDDASVTWDLLEQSYIEYIHKLGYAGQTRTLDRARCAELLKEHGVNSNSDGDTVFGLNVKNAVS